MASNNLYINNARAREFRAALDGGAEGLARYSLQYFDRAQVAIEDILYILDARGWRGDALEDDVHTIACAMDEAREAVECILPEE